MPRILSAPDGGGQFHPPVVSFIRRYAFDGKLGEFQIQQRRKSSFTPVENRTTITQSSSPKPSHYTD
jgi:hypothetical protein